MLRYQVKLGGAWTPVDRGVVLADGRLAWWKGDERGIARVPRWLLQESTRVDPAFLAACWDALSAEEKAYSLSRRRLVA